MRPAYRSNPFEGQNDPLPSTLSELGFRHEFADLNGVMLSYLRGPEVGSPLVLVPAQMGTYATYAKVMPALAEHFTVYVVEVRGHGNSSWTPGDYTWASVGGDLRLFLDRVVRRPALVSGNSSGGVLALWLAANAPDLISGVVLEDAPVFSVEMPRFAERDRFVYKGLTHFVEVLGDREHRHLADYFRGQELPVSARRTKRMPGWFVNMLDRGVTRYEQEHPGQPSGISVWWLPQTMSDSSGRCRCSTRTSRGPLWTAASTGPSRTRRRCERCAARCCCCTRPGTDTRSTAS